MITIIIFILLIILFIYACFITFFLSKKQKTDIETTRRIEEINTKLRAETNTLEYKARTAEQRAIDLEDRIKEADERHSLLKEKILEQEKKLERKQKEIEEKHKDLELILSNPEKETMQKEILELQNNISNLKELKERLDQELAAEKAWKINEAKASAAKEIDKINKELETAKSSLRIVQEQELKKRQKEDFIVEHSIQLNESDKKDIELLKELSKTFHRPDAVKKLLWTEYIQKPLQQLRKQLSLDGTKGIYKITEIGTDYSYIGQSMNVGDRIITHIKTGLGIGSSASLSNKFYKVLAEKGPQSFTYEILESGDINLDEREKYWIDFYDSIRFGFNSKIGG